jgi:hypothetical protein
MSKILSWVEDSKETSIESLIDHFVDSGMKPKELAAELHHLIDNGYIVVTRPEFLKKLKPTYFEQGCYDYHV